MTNALDLALANAAANAPKGEELHLENLDAIANPEREEVILHQYDPNRVVVPEPPQYNPRDVAFRPQGEEDNYYPRLNPSKLTLDSIDYKLGEITNAVMHLHCKIDSLTYTIQTAAETMPQERNLKHRSLHEWDDSTLLNELVERENDLMPFYYELLKRIGSPELQSLVMSSMQGKNASMVTLAQLCSALAPQPIPQQQPMPQQQVDINAELARIAAMNADERQIFVDKMNQSPFAPYQTIPAQPHHFRQTAEEYIKSSYTDKPVQNRIG